MKNTINASHHTYDGTIGFAQAEDVQKYWKSRLHHAFINAFRLASDFDAYGGASRLFVWQDNVVKFPGGHSEKIKELDFTSTGIAAAATSDGRVAGDGQIKIEEWPNVKPITLFNHSAYILNAGTLDPVANIGDIILVQNFGKARPRDLVVVAFGDKLYARRLNESEDHSDVVVLTGSIGSGKSTAAEILGRLGAAVVSADTLARDAVEKGSLGLEKIVAAFGKEMLRDDGTLDRKKLAVMVFADSKNRIMN